MNDTPLLDIGAETDGDLVEVAPEDRPAPDGRPVVDRDLAREDHVRGHVGVDGDLGEPLPQRDDLPLASVVPFHAIRRRRRRDRLRSLGGEAAAEGAVAVVGNRGG